MRISDWSSDVCSSDLREWQSRRDRLADVPSAEPGLDLHDRAQQPDRAPETDQLQRAAAALPRPGADHANPPGDRQSVVQGKTVSVRVNLGGRRIINKQKRQKQHNNINDRKKKT